MNRARQGRADAALALLVATPVPRHGGNRRTLAIVLFFAVLMRVGSRISTGTRYRDMSTFGGIRIANPQRPGMPYSCTTPRRGGTGRDTRASPGPRTR